MEDVPTLVYAEGDTSVLQPVSSEGSAIVHVFWFTLIFAILIFVGVTGTLLYSVYAHRARPGRNPAQFRGNRRAEIAWTAAPAALLAIVLTMSVQTMNQVTSASGTPLAITVVGHQWWWELRYDGGQVTTANELHVPVGQPVVLNLQSADVIHSFWVPQLAGKSDLIPGHPYTLNFTVDRAGTYAGACSEFCGVAHAWMLLRVVAQSPTDYSAWLQAQRATAVAPSGSVVAGAQLFQNQTCGSCHAIAGTAATAAIGPNLTHVASRATIGAGVLDNTPANMRLWLTDPQAVKPGTLMPNFKLTPAQVSDLTNYLESLR